MLCFVSSVYVLLIRVVLKDQSVKINDMHASET